MKEFGMRLSRIGLALLLPALLIFTWQFLAQRINNPWLLPGIEKVLARLTHPLEDIFGTGSLLSNLIVSLLRVLFGFLLAALVGIPLGLLMGYLPIFRRLFGSLVEMFRPLCPIAWVPFALAIFKTYSLVNLFGVRYSNTIFDHIQIGMLFILFYGAFFPILLNTMDGVLGVRDIHIESALVLGAKPRQVFWKVIFPASLPSIFTGLRIGLGVSWMVIIAAEMLPGSDSGIGYLIIYGYQLARMDIVITGMILIGLVSALLSFLVRFFSQPLVGWQAKER
ncbi:MAG: ABC transporter permease [candidate division WOR-3 bacterium]